MKTRARKNAGGRRAGRRDDWRKPRKNAIPPGTEWGLRYGLIPQTGVTVFASSAHDDLTRLVAILRDKNSWDLDPNNEKRVPKSGAATLVPWIVIDEATVMGWVENGYAGGNGIVWDDLRVQVDEQGKRFARPTPSARYAIQDFACSCLQLGIEALKTLLSPGPCGPAPDGSAGNSANATDAFEGLARMAAGNAAGHEDFRDFFDLARCLRNDKFTRDRARYQKELVPRRAVPIRFDHLFNSWDWAYPPAVSTDERLRRAQRFAERINRGGDVRIEGFAKR